MGAQRLIRLLLLLALRLPGKGCRCAAGRRALPERSALPPGCCRPLAFTAYCSAPQGPDPHAPRPQVRGRAAAAGCAAPPALHRVRPEPRVPGGGAAAAAWGLIRPSVRPYAVHSCLPASAPSLHPQPADLPACPPRCRWGPYREGVVKRSAVGQGSWLDVGLDKDAHIPQVRGCAA